MSTTLHYTAPFGRFSTALATGECPKPIYDRALCEWDGCIATPTLGSILPDWLLIIPRRQALNFSQWFSETRFEPARVIKNFLSQRRISEDRAIWFEHGSKNRGSILGCGVEHAHLHLLIDTPFSFDEFTTAVMSSSDLVWSKIVGPSSYERLCGDESYLFMACGDRQFVAKNVEAVGSQFFRRVVAAMAGQREAWDYKAFPHINNIEMTIHNFSR
jgi:ATP adenylyltransferase